VGFLVQRGSFGRRSKVRNPFFIGRDQRGATAVEYGLILALIFLAVAGAIKGVATVTIGMWSNVSNDVSSAH
jgi:pilus assembly protein Flp/PilA